jgi:chromosome segregation ATPase
MLFLSTIWHYSKLLVTSVGSLLALAMLIGGIVIGPTTQGIIIIVGGSVFLVQSIILFFDNSKIHAQMKEHLKKLDTELNYFESQNKIHSANVQKFVDENRTLIKSLDRTQKQLDRLTSIKDEYEITYKKYNALLLEQKTQLIEQGEQIKLYQSENDELKVTLIEIQNLEAQMKIELEKYRKTIIDSETQILLLEKTKDSFLEENKKLQEINISNESQLTSLKEQVVKLKQLYTNSLELLNNLKQAGDLFNQFGESIGTQVIKLDNVSESLEVTQTELDETVVIFQNLIDKLKQTNFQKLDTNTDGNISIEEFNNNLSKL